MAINEITAMGIACIIANSPADKEEKIISKLSQQEKIAVKEYYDKGACLPEHLEKLLTRDRLSPDIKNKTGGVEAMPSFRTSGD